MDDVKSLLGRIDHLSQELADIKRILLSLELRDKTETEASWQDLMAASKEISKLWKGPSAVDEIKGQREKAG